MSWSIALRFGTKRATPRPVGLAPNPQLPPHFSAFLLGSRHLQPVQWKILSRCLCCTPVNRCLSFAHQSSSLLVPFPILLLLLRLPSGAALFLSPWLSFFVGQLLLPVPWLRFGEMLRGQLVSEFFKTPFCFVHRFLCHVECLRSYKQVFLNYRQNYPWKSPKIGLLKMKQKSKEENFPQGELVCLLCRSSQSVIGWLRPW